MRKKTTELLPFVPEGGPRKIYVMLMRFRDGGSRTISFMTRSFYTHASIGLEEDLGTYYSFVCRGFWRRRCEGFLIEKVDRYNRPDREPFPCCLYELSVSEETYAAVKGLLRHFAEHQEAYRYARFGIVMGLLRIPFKYRRHYFCSQFVAEVLSRARAAVLRKRACLYMPGDFTKLPGVSMVYQGDLLDFESKFLPSRA